VSSSSPAATDGETHSPDEAPRTGPHRVLIAVYALFTLAAGARSAVQLATDAEAAPVAYGLSALAACTYAAGWYAIARAAQGRTRLARVLLWVELGGVVAVGTLSLAKPAWFTEPSVWSGFGLGYGFVPVALPVCGLLWLRSARRQAATGASQLNTGRFGRRTDR
jgi:hypothetical protein